MISPLTNRLPPTSSRRDGTVPCHWTKQRYPLSTESCPKTHQNLRLSRTPFTGNLTAGSGRFSLIRTASHGSRPSFQINSMHAVSFSYPDRAPRIAYVLVVRHVIRGKSARLYRLPSDLPTKYWTSLYPTPSPTGRLHSPQTVQT